MQFLDACVVARAVEISPRQRYIGRTRGQYRLRHAPKQFCVVSRGLTEPFLRPRRSVDAYRNTLASPDSSTKIIGNGLCRPLALVDTGGLLAMLATVGPRERKRRAAHRGVPVGSLVRA